MALFLDSVFGEISGSVGSLTFRRLHGKVFVCKRPDSFIPGRDPESVARRGRFGIAGKLARAIYSVRELAEVWRKAAPEGMQAYNYITKIMFGLADAEGENLDTIPLLPARQSDANLRASVVGYAVGENGVIVRVKVSNLEGRVDPLNLRLAFVLCAPSLSAEGAHSYTFISGCCSPCNSFGANGFEVELPCKCGAVQEGSVMLITVLSVNGNGGVEE